MGSTLAAGRTLRVDTVSKIKYPTYRSVKLAAGEKTASSDKLRSHYRTYRTRSTVLATVMTLGGRAGVTNDWHLRS